MQILHKPENKKLQEKLNVFAIERLALILARVFS